MKPMGCRSSWADHLLLLRRRRRHGQLLRIVADQTNAIVAADVATDVYVLCGDTRDTHSTNNTVKY